MSETRRARLSNTALSRTALPPRRSSEGLDWKGGMIHREEELKLLLAREAYALSICDPSAEVPFCIHI